MLRKLCMSRVILCNCVINWLDIFAARVFFSCCCLCCIYVCCIYYLYFSFSTLQWIKLIISQLSVNQARTRSVSDCLNGWRQCFEFPSVVWHCCLGDRYKSSQYPFHLSVICAASVKFSPVAEWIHCRRGWNFVVDWTIFETPVWNFLSRFLLLIPHACLPVAAVYSLWAFSAALPSVLDIGSYLCLLLLSFPWLLRKCHQISISFSSATWRIQSFLWPLPAGLSWYLSSDLLGLPHHVQPPMP